MIELGRQAKDVVTDLEGIVVGRCRYMNGCVQYLIKGKMREDGKVSSEWVDSQQVIVTGPGILVELADITKRNAAMEVVPSEAPATRPLHATGGPHPDAPPT